MPMAIPLIGAAFSISEGLAIGGMLGGLMTAGGAVTLLGAASGDKGLMQIGGVLGMVGGIGNLASGVSTGMTQAEGTQIVGDYEKGLPGMGDSTPPAEAPGSGVTTSAAGQTMTAQPPGVGGPTGLASLPGSVNSPAAAFGNSQPGLISDAAAQAPLGAGSQSSQALAADTARQVNAYESGLPKMPEAPSGPTTSSGFGGSGTDPSVQGPQAPKSPGSSWGDKANTAFKWMRDNPEATKQVGGLVQGAMKYYGDQQMADDNMRRQMAYQDWVRQRYSDSVRNVKIPVLTAPQSSGIIGNARG
jgi:hypothetical protein